MKKSSKQQIGSGSDFDRAGLSEIDRPFHEELQDAYLEYSYSVIYARALPDARDGLKPVHRRILWAMNEMGVRPEKPHVKSARIVGDCMGKYHPHGDSAIYESMVRLAQDFSLSFPLVDGHGAFGTNDDGPAASRYTEARMSAAGALMLDGIDEDTVDMRDNYDQTLQEPRVLPAAFPNALVNGGSGIAVGMATNMIPHNLAETVNAARHLLAHPDASLDDLMAHVPGPDLPTGGLVLGADQIRQAYSTGRGIVRLRARTEIGPLEGSRGRQAITATELPYGVGPEKVIDAVRKAVTARKLDGIADVKDLTDMSTDGTRLVIETKVGVNPEALLADLYRYTPLETSFGIINNVLYRGKPQELGLVELLRIFLEHRVDVVTRRTRFRLNKAETRRHLVEGLLVALDNVDKVVKIIRSSSSTTEARDRLLTELGAAKVRLGAKSVARTLDETQVGHILEMPLRRLVSLEVDALRTEWDTLTETIAYLNTILDDETVLRGVIDDELADIVTKHGRPRRTTLVDGDLKEALAASAPVALEVPDDPCTVTLSTSGLVGRFAADHAVKGKRGKHDALVSTVPTTARATLGAVTSTGRLLHLPVVTVPAPPDGDTKFRGVPVSEYVDVAAGEHVLALVEIGEDAPMLALATRGGFVKRIAPAEFGKRSGQEIIGFKDPADTLAGVAVLPVEPDAADLVFVTTDAQLLRTPAGAVRPQGRTGGGMAGVKLADGATVLTFAAVPAEDDAALVVTATDGSGVKTTPLAEYPSKGRGTGGVRCMRMLKGETVLTAAYVGPGPVTGVGDKGELVELPAEHGKRDAAGARLDTPVAAIAPLRS